MALPINRMRIPMSLMLYRTNKPQFVKWFNDLTTGKSCNVFSSIIPDTTQFPDVCFGILNHKTGLSAKSVQILLEEKICREKGLDVFQSLEKGQLDERKDRVDEQVGELHSMAAAEQARDPLLPFLTKQEQQSLQITELEKTLAGKTPKLNALEKRNKAVSHEIHDKTVKRNLKIIAISVVGFVALIGFAKAKSRGTS